MGTQDRIARIARRTKETNLAVEVNLDGRGLWRGSVGLGFLEHMLELLARHSGIDISVEGGGDLHVDAHHTVEDLGITLGRALAKAAGEKAGMARFGQAAVPMEEALAEAVLDFCGRPYLSFQAELPAQKVGDFDAELTEDFFRALAMHAGFTLHLRLLEGRNTHHIIEALFKALARALGQATRRTAGSDDVLSTKGAL